MVLAVPWEGAPADQLPNFYHAVLTFERPVYGLNVTTTKKVNFLVEKSAPPQIRKSWLRVREKGPRLTLESPPPNG